MKHDHWAVFAGFHFIANDRHFSVEVFLEHGHVDHAVRLKLERPTQIVVTGVESLEVHGLVVRSGAVEIAGAAVCELLEKLAAGRGCFEDHVFQQVSHAGFTIPLVARADHVDHVHGDFRLGIVREQQHMQAVGK